jgi:LPXTG-site transpeptidase (sortase) family protein
VRRRWLVLLALIPIVAALIGTGWLLTVADHNSTPAVVGGSVGSTAAGEASSGGTAAPGTSSVVASPAAGVAGGSPAGGSGASASGAIPSASVARLRVPRIGVDAGVVTLSVSADGTMPAPSKPMDVASYTFAALPGQVGNVVLAGHVDFAGFGPAVFYRLRELRAGDEFSVALSDGTYFEYRVSSVAVYEDETAPVAEIVGPTPTETATLITCTGVFDAAAHAYNERLVIRADRVA